MRQNELLPVGAPWVCSTCHRDQLSALIGGIRCRFECGYAFYLCDICGGKAERLKREETAHNPACHRRNKRVARPVMGFVGVPEKDR